MTKVLQNAGQDQKNLETDGVDLKEIESYAYMGQKVNITTISNRRLYAERLSGTVNSRASSLFSNIKSKGPGASLSPLY